MGRGVGGGRRTLSIAQLTAGQRMFNKQNSWKVFKVDPDEVRKVMARYGVPELVARLALAKGPDNEGMDLDYLLDPSLERMVPLQSVEDREGYEPRRALARLRQAVESGEKVGLHGDYDSDGIMSSLIVYKALRHYMPRTRLETFLPGRDSGYGFRVENLEHLADLGCTLIVTTDCGTRDIETVAAAKARGVDVIIIDHHELPEGEDFAREAIVVNPRILGRDPAPQFHSFCASGLAWKVARELHLEMLGEVPVGFNDDLAFSAIGTIADMVPLTYENRILVYHGLRAMNETTRQESLTTMRRWSATAYRKLTGFQQPTALDVGMNLAPYINIGKRLADTTVDAKYVWGFLSGELTRVEQTKRMAAIRQLYDLKRILVTKFGRSAKPLIERQTTFGHFIVLEDMPDGLCGQIANQLMRASSRPTIVLTTARKRDAGLLFGSGRAPYPIDFLSMVDEVRRENTDLIPSKLGGHPQSVGGIKIKPEDFSRFCDLVEQKLQDWVASVPEIKTEPPSIHMAVKIGDWTPELAHKVVHEIAPYGIGNPEAVFASYGVHVAEKIRGIRQDGKPKVDVEYVFEQDGARIRALSRQSDTQEPEFGISGNDARDVPVGAVVNIMYNVALSEDGAPVLRLKMAKVIEAPDVEAAQTAPAAAPAAA